MSLNVPLPKATLQRLPKIKYGLMLGWNYGQIGDACGVTEKTIDRDIGKWTRSGQFEQWLKEEWLRLHIIIQKEDPVEAYKQLSKLISHVFTRKIEVTESVEVEEHISLDFSGLTEEERALFRKAAALYYLRRNSETSSSGRPIRLH